jgi:hypothetical protein
MKCGSGWMSVRATSFNSRNQALATNSYLRAQPRTCGINGFLVCLKNSIRELGIGIELQDIMTTQETAYTEIERLVKSFKDMPAAQRKGLNEMQTRLGYILPLFKALGWDTSNINEVSPEEKVSRGWVDFSFRIGNVPRFFLETKKVNENLNDPRWVKQAIDYSWTN